MSTLSVVVGCMGRLLEAQQFVPAVLKVLDANDELVFVDFADPGHSGDWVVKLGDARCTVVAYSPAAWYAPNLVRNLGCRVAVGDLLVVCDVDKLWPAELVNECRSMQKGEFLVQDNSTGSIGWLCMWFSDFRNVNGYEEALAGYGWDDFVMRESLQKSGLAMRFCKHRVYSTPLEIGCRSYPDERRHVSSHVNQRLSRDLRILHPFRGNIARNWGAGGVVVCESEAARHEGKTRERLSAGWWRS